MNDVERQAPTLLLAPDDYRRLHETASDEQLRSAYIGVWPDREALGQELLAESRASDRLTSVPTWLVRYVRFDGTAYVRDQEASGVYVIAEVRQGICVFDGDSLYPTPKLLQFESDE